MSWVEQGVEVYCDFLWELIEKKKLVILLSLLNPEWWEYVVDFVDSDKWAISAAWDIDHKRTFGLFVYFHYHMYHCIIGLKNSIYAGFISPISAP